MSFLFGIGWDERWVGGRIRRRPALMIYLGHALEVDAYELRIAWGRRWRAPLWERFYRRNLVVRGPNRRLLDLHPWTWWLPVRPIVRHRRLAGYSRGYGLRARCWQWA